MQLGDATLTLQHGSRAARVNGTHVRFSAHKCFLYDDGADDLACLALLDEALGAAPRLAVAVDDGGRFLEDPLKHRPDVRSRIACVVQPRAFGAEAERATVCGLPVAAVHEIPDDVSTVLLAETRMFPRMQMRRALPPRFTLVDPDAIGAHPERLPARAWIPWSREVIYPIDIPEIAFQSGLDVLLVDCPARNLGLMPNGLGYVHNALKHTGVRFQTLDLDILLYHRFHVRRLFDEGGTMRLASGRELPTDPWQAEHYDFWTQAETLDFVADDIEEIAAKIVAARPRVLAMSIQGCNEGFSARVVQRVRERYPGVIVLVGGFSCYNADIGFAAFPHADYMCVGEADLTVGELAERLAAGERPRNMPGVLSKTDDPALPFIPAPMPHDLDLLDHPTYEWFDLDVYRNYNGYQLTPVIASRGCRWSRCTFCAERFYWRIRSASDFVDELEWLVEQGCHLFMFNESDLNGMPEKVLEICDEIIRRGINVKLTGQLRVHKKSDRAFFDKLKQAGFVALRFGVDAFSENTLRLQKKGYTKATVTQNLRDCREAGIYTEINWVIGVPGETDADVEEGIEFILENQRWIGRLANINPLILVNGGVYWLEPDKHNIVFREPREELYAKFKRAIPAHLWYSTDPYIDELVRKERFERIVVALHERGFRIGPWAARIIEDVQKARDKMRAGERAAAAQAAADAARAEAAAAGDGESTAALAGGNGANAAKAGKGLAFNPDARSTEYVFRAGSVLPDDEVAPVETRVVLVRGGDEIFAFEPAVLTGAFGDGVVAPGDGSTRLAPGVRVLRAVAQGARPELARAVGSYNIVKYDGVFYAVPQSMGQVEWGTTDLSMAPGVFASQTMRTIVRQVEEALGLEERRGRKKPAPPRARTPTMIPLTLNAPRTRAVPRLVGSLDSYNVVEYQGWHYGLPQALGEIDLAKTDVIEMPGVIRDLSREVVEGEIRELLARNLPAQ